MKTWKVKWEKSTVWIKILTRLLSMKKAQGYNWWNTVSTITKMNILVQIAKQIMIILHLKNSDKSYLYKNCQKQYQQKNADMCHEPDNMVKKSWTWQYGKKVFASTSMRSSHVWRSRKVHGYWYKALDPILSGCSGNRMVGGRYQD